MFTNVIKKLLLFSLFALLAVSFSAAQASNSAPAAILVFADDMQEVEVLDFTGAVVEDVDFGAQLLIGFAIRTGRTTAELRLEPNGSIMRLSEQTFLKFEELQGLSNTEANSAALIDGRVRMVAARVRGQNYRIKTPTAALGVRGTDFAVSLDETGNATIAVEEGRVAVYNPQTRETAEVEGGNALTAREQTLASIEAEMEEVAALMEEFAVARAEEVPSDSNYESEFDYFTALEAEAYREFFADDDYFEDYQEYLRRFRSYYESEMENFQEILKREEEELRRREQETDEALKADEQSFQEWLEEN